MSNRLPFRVRSVYAKVLIFFTISAILLLLLANTMADRVGDTNEYRAEFADVSGLRAGDDVRVAGVQVGKVTGVEVDPRTSTSAVVTFTLRRDQKLLSNATLVMRYQNLLGQRYVSVVQPKERAAALPPGTKVPMERTSPGFDLTSLLNGFRPLFDVLEPQDVNTLSESVIKVLQGEGGTVQNLLGQVAELTNFLADRDQLFANVFHALTPVLNDLAAQGDQLRGTVRDLTAFTSGLAKQRKTWGASIQRMATNLDATEKLVVDLRKPVAKSVQRAQGLLAMYVAEKDRFADSISSLGQLMDALGRVMSYRDALTFYFCALDLDFGGFSVETSTLPSEYSEVCR